MSKTKEGDLKVKIFVMRMPVVIYDALEKATKEEGLSYKKEYVLKILCKELGYKYIHEKESIEKI